MWGRESGFKRYYTPKEANALLGDAVQWLQGLRRAVLRARTLDRASQRDVSGGISDPALDAAKDDVANWLNRFDRHGVSVEGIDPARMDFPAMYKGREVLLCWQEGDSRVSTWRPLESSMSRRRPIDLTPGAWEWLH